MYLINNRDPGCFFFKPDFSKGFCCYADADFHSKWNKEFGELDPYTANFEVDGLYCTLIVWSFGA